jgi:hypothetical protein
MQGARQPADRKSLRSILHPPLGHGIAVIGLGAVGFEHRAHEAQSGRFARRRLMSLMLKVAIFIARA